MATHKALAALASMGIKAGDKLAPALELDIFPHRMYAKGRPWWYMDAYRAAPGWFILKVGGWTVDVCWKMEKELAA